MASKNWKLRKNKPHWIIWEGRISGREIWVIKGQWYGTHVKDFDKFVVYLHSIATVSNETGNLGMFATKEGAIRFAKSYMRTHD